jgi:hypothetical protein
MTISYYSKDVYGTTLYYLADFYAAQQWKAISGKKTITEHDMDVLAMLTGATFERTYQPQLTASEAA